MGNADSMKWPSKVGRNSRVESSNHWKNIDYLALDLELTGLDLNNDEIISIGSVAIQGGRVLGSTQFYQEIKPIQSPSVASMQIHGLRAVDLADAKTLKEIVPELRTHMSGKVLIAHAAWIERAFLYPHLRGSFPSHLIDTAALARACGYGERTPGHEPSLEFLARQLNLPVFSPHHALGDAMTTAVVFLALATELEKREREKDGATLSFSTLLETSRKNS
jgi:DNA polymerase-3 subunit epsilon